MFFGQAAAYEYSILWQALAWKVVFANCGRLFALLASLLLGASVQGLVVSILILSVYMVLYPAEDELHVPKIAALEHTPLRFKLPHDLYN